MTQPSEHEDNWIKDQERKNSADSAAAAAHQAEIGARPKCPRDGGFLKEVSYEGVKIDRCDTCNGVWLDPGELEQLTETQAPGLFGFLTRR